MRQKMHLLIEGASGFFFSKKSGDDYIRALISGPMPYLGMNVPLPSGICPLCVFSIKLCPIIIIRAKIMIHWGFFPCSTVPIKALN